MLLSAKKRLIEIDEPEEVQPIYKRLNTSQLEFRYNLNRQTIAKRLRENGIEPVEAKAKEKIYEVTPQLVEILQRSTTAFDDVKLRGEEAKASLAEVKVAQVRGELVPMGEVVDVVQRIHGAMYKELAVRMPQEIAHRLAKAKTKAECSKIIKIAVDRRFKTLKDDFEGFLK